MALAHAQQQQRNDARQHQQGHHFEQCHRQMRNGGDVRRAPEQPDCAKGGGGHAERPGIKRNRLRHAGGVDPGRRVQARAHRPGCQRTEADGVAQRVSDERSGGDRGGGNVRAGIAQAGRVVAGQGDVTQPRGQHGEQQVRARRGLQRGDHIGVVHVIEQRIQAVENQRAQHEHHTDHDPAGEA